MKRSEYDRRYLVKKKCFCVDCGKLLSHQNARRCRGCWVLWKVGGNGGIPPSQKGREHLYFRGESNPAWRGGITPKNQVIRHSKEYWEWRVSVFQRDGYKCQACGQVGGKLNAHHIVEFCVDESRRFDIDNGVTMCKKCHYKVHKKFYGNQYTK